MEEEHGSVEEMKKKKVMVAIDVSEYSHYALEWAMKNLGDSIANSELFIFTVQPIAEYSYLYASSFGAARTLSHLSHTKLRFYLPNYMKSALSPSVQLFY